MSRLALGTVQFGLPYGIFNQTGQVDHPEAKRLLQLALDSGIDTLDTAVAYGDSEILLGTLGTQGFKLVTKLPAMPDTCLDVAKWVRQQVSESLLRLGVKAVYGLLLHRSEQLLGTNGVALYNALQGLKDSGQVLKVGVSIYTPTELSALIPRFYFDLVQAPFNLVDRCLVSTGWLQRLKDDDVEIHTRSAFFQGLLLMPHSDIPKKFQPWAALWRTWHGWLVEHDTPAVQACLSFPLSFPEIDRIVVGVDSLNQLAQIIRYSYIEPIKALPDLQCQDGRLINPGNWKNL